ncbi:paralemmin-3-like [Lynx pardinus]|uniref:Paralemmin-3-like n=1 Tax=Lynx pardinus TaxID=191816 RepID=A0A485P229_LYNPA|nr:paralemmin-3-like [Lynx pardinus]
METSLQGHLSIRPMAESSLYRQRLEVIAIRAARRELEEEKLRVERLKRKSLRERWLMDGAAEGPEQQEDSTSKDPQSPEGQAQARIRNLEDSLFTLQSQLQLLQSASTGAQHKSPGRPTWRRQGHRPLSQPTVEAGPTGSHTVAPCLLSFPPLTPQGHTDLSRRASLPAGPVDTSPESPSEPRDEAVRVPPTLRLFPGAAGASSEANGPCPGPSPAAEQGPSQGLAASEGGVGEAKGGGVVEVVWEGLRATEDCATEATGPELEAKVEEMVLEAIGDRQEAACPEPPSWVKEDRGIVEVVWEGVGGPESSDSEATGEGGRGQKAAQTSSPRPQVRLEGAAPGEGGVPRGSSDGDGPGGSGGEEGSFIWVERVTLSEEWEELGEELVVEGLEGPRARGSGGGPESPLGVERGAGEDAWGAGRSQAEEPVESVGEGKKGTEEEAGADVSLVGERGGSEGSLEPERGGGEEELRPERKAVEEPPSAARKAVEGPLRAERERGEGPLRVEQKEDEEKLEATEEPLVTEGKEGEKSLEAEKGGGEAPSEAERTGGEALLGAEKGGGEAPLGAEKGGGEAPSEAERGGEASLKAEKTDVVEEDLSPEEQRESRGGKECQAEEVSEAGASLGAKEESRPEEEGPQPQEKQEGSLEEESVRPQTPAEGQGPSGDATTPLLAETPAPEQPAECQPLLQVEGPRANPSARPVPTYAPARQPEPPAPPEGEEASGPKQKTCQCCVVM